MQIISPIKATIIKRYKRFLADVELEDSITPLTVYVPNTGSMKTCYEKGWPVILSHQYSAKRKYPHTLVMTHNGDSWIGIHTGITNDLVEEALQNQVISDLANYRLKKREVKIGKSRLDFSLENNAGEIYYLEAKNVTYKENNYALFPDSVSTRGHKHLEELIEIKKSGQKAGIIFVIQREDIDYMSASNPIDPTYTELLYKAHDAGVDIMAYQCSLTDSEININRKVEIKFN